VLMLTIGAAVLLIPAGAVVTLMMGVWVVAWVAVSIVALVGALLFRDRLPGLGSIPRRVIGSALLGIGVLTIGVVALFFGYFMLTAYPETASAVMDRTELPEGAIVIDRRDSGTESASYSVTFVALAEPDAARSVKFPSGFVDESDLDRIGPAECDWATPKPCEADRVALVDGAAADFANGHCGGWVSQQSNTVERDGVAVPVVVINVSCAEGMPKAS